MDENGTKGLMVMIMLLVTLLLVWKYGEDSQLPLSAPHMPPSLHPLAVLPSRLLSFSTDYAAILVPSILATEFVVGDDKGWTINFDYQAWAQGKEFHVGDTLVFKYKEGAHNVLKVNGTGFQQCAAPAGTEALISGSDVIPLALLGRKWYICGVAKHCEVENQKLFITVLPQTVSPAPSPISAAN
ncbi:blue copper protein 1b-like [Alnus glutinosa]|uniref:blue copper protein 1b-like n=1 Tax=Alnus glutinosa TaxID=3517 RepID=UPI002D76DD6B|nr:blue copper protein 1b-like [Alnus glutinosa]